jgi:FKBP-type peptidyl-prolyl cis-trans isomerase FkpA
MNASLLVATLLALPAASAVAADAPAQAAPAEAPASTDAAPAAAEKAAAPKNSDSRTLYKYGVLIGHGIAPIGFSEAELKQIFNGMKDGALEKATIDMNVEKPAISALIQAHVAAKVPKTKAKGAAFAEKFSKEDGVKPIPNGGWYKMLKEGTGAAPTADDTVKVDYRGTLIDGTEFDSSYKRGEPATFPLKNVIPCWTNGVAQLKVGGKAKLVCPSDAAYGDQGEPRAGISGGSTLVFEVALLGIEKPEPKAAAKDAPASDSSSDNPRRK